MDIKISQALRNYGAVTEASKNTGYAGSALGQATTEFADTLAKSEAVATQAMVGDADPHALVEALANTQLAVETAVTVRDRVVEAYQEILRMPV